jgi:hypothetical protein
VANLECRPTTFPTLNQHCNRRTLLTSKRMAWKRQETLKFINLFIVLLCPVISRNIWTIIYK